MGTFFKAFWSRMGRNAGNRVSNAVFGDKWSTPYRVAVDKSRRQKHSAEAGPPPRRRSASRRKGANRQRGASSGSNIWYWILGIVLFGGTYNAILYPKKDEIVLVIMLWIVAIGLFLFKSRNKA